MWFKQNGSALGDFEQLVLFGVRRLEDGAYGAAIRQEIHARSGRDVSINAVYTTLDRLESKGCLRSSMGEATEERGGKARRYYAVTAAGMKAIRAHHEALSSLTRGLESILSHK